MIKGLVQRGTQGLARRQVIKVQRQQGGNVFFGRLIEHAGKQLLLAVEVVVHQLLGDAGGAGNVIHARAGQAMGGKSSPRHFQQAGNRALFGGGL
jgi:hypothetical protein